jgi:hypothetical protein
MTDAFDSYSTLRRSQRPSRVEFYLDCAPNCGKTRVQIFDTNTENILVD